VLGIGLGIVSGLRPGMFDTSARCRSWPNPIG
jgi:hypothetical protein